MPACLVWLYNASRLTVWCFRTIFFVLSVWSPWNNNNKKNKTKKLALWLYVLFQWPTSQFLVKSWAHTSLILLDQFKLVIWPTIRYYQLAQIWEGDVSVSNIICIGRHGKIKYLAPKLSPQVLPDPPVNYILPTDIIFPITLKFNFNGTVAYYTYQVWQVCTICSPAPQFIHDHTHSHGCSVLDCSII